LSTILEPVGFERFSSESETPTGGQVTYGYTTFSDSYSNRSRWLSSRTSAGGVWSYTPQVISTCSSTQVGCQEKETISKPDGSYAVNTFTLDNGAWLTQTQQYDNQSNLMATTATTWDFSNACVLLGCHGHNFIREVSETATVPIPGGTSVTKKTAYSYDTPQKGNVTAIQEWGFYPGTSPTFPSVPDRATYLTYYSTGTNIINKPLSVTLCNNSGSNAACLGGGSKVSQTLVTYDSYGAGLTNIAGVANHDDTNFGVSNTARGNPTQIQQWVSGSTKGSSGYAAWGMSEGFDRYGNRLNQSQTAGSPPTNSLTFATTPAPPANPPGGAYTNRPDGFSFDASGNMLYDGNNNLTFDAENCLITAANSGSGTTTYTCDAHGIRVKKALQSGTSTAYVFAGNTDVAEYDYTTGNPLPGSPSREYIYAGDRLTATIQGSTTIYHHSDHLSVRVTSDVNGNKIGAQGHYPYGEQWYATNTTSKFIFTSYERDAESGNDYAMARYYVNRFARFCSADPLMGSPGDPQSWNRYAYVRNDPINAIDPTGQSVFSWIVKAFQAIAAFLFGPPLSSGAGTPPIIDNGPLSDTTGLLTSLYHPIDPSRFGISNLTAGSTIYGPKSSCEDFSESLAGRLYNALKPSGFEGVGADLNRQRLGKAMVTEAYKDVDQYGNTYRKRQTKYGIDGFRPELVANGQGPDVYRHILFTAGSKLLPGGDNVDTLFTAVDYAQSQGSPTITHTFEAQAELLDDFAGQSVGESMLQTAQAGKKGNYAALATRIMRILCF
jgi:RHS repeat-associated protein